MKNCKSNIINLIIDNKICQITNKNYITLINNQLIINQYSIYFYEKFFTFFNH